MQIKEVENKGLKRAYEVLIKAADLDKQIEAELREVGKKVKMPGFRPGKIPTPVLKQRYGKSVMGDVFQRAAEDASRSILKEKKITPALAPDIKIKDYEEGGDLSLSITLELMPEVPEVTLDKIHIERPTFEIDDEEMNRALEVMAQRQRNLKEKPKTAKAAAGDVVQIDFKGFIGKEAFEGGDAKGYHLELGSGQFIPGFEDQLIGVKAGDELDVKVPFPKDYHKQDLAGKEARFEVKVHLVKTPEVPAIDEDFAKSVGFEKLDELKEILKKQLESDYGTLVRNRMKKQLFDQLEELCAFDIPEQMVKLEFDSIWQQHEQAVRYGEKSDVPEEEQKQEYRAIAERRVRLGIFLSDVAKKNNVQVTREELSDAVQRQASMYPGQERKIFEFYRDHPEHVNELRGPILEEKAVDILFTKIKIKDKASSVAELLKEDEETEAGGKPKKKAAKAKASSDKDDAGAEKKAAKAPASKPKKKSASEEK